jgi:hypothetical protein
MSTRYDVEHRRLAVPKAYFAYALPISSSVTICVRSVQAVRLASRLHSQR